MPIRIPNDLPATKTLTEENIFVMTETRAVSQDIRPLEILVLNLMPTKIARNRYTSRNSMTTPMAKMPASCQKPSFLSSFMR